MFLSPCILLVEIDFRLNQRIVVEPIPHECFSRCCWLNEAHCYGCLCQRRGDSVENRIHIFIGNVEIHKEWVC